MGKQRRASVHMFNTIKRSSSAKASAIWIAEVVFSEIVTAVWDAGGIGFSLCWRFLIAGIRAIGRSFRSSLPSVWSFCFWLPTYFLRWSFTPCCSLTSFGFALCHCWSTCRIKSPTTFRFTPTWTTGFTVYPTLTFIAAEPLSKTATGTAFSFACRHFSYRRCYSFWQQPCGIAPCGHCDRQSSGASLWLLFYNKRLFWFFSS